MVGKTPPSALLPVHKLLWPPKGFLRAGPEVLLVVLEAVPPWEGVAGTRPACPTLSLHFPRALPRG